jgi:hypothetical protein
MIYQFNYERQGNHKNTESLGWEIKSINGSHHQMIKDGMKVTVR